MKKKILLRCALGAPMGLSVSTAITIAISLFAGDGYFYPVVPELIADCGSEINAVLLQSVCSLLYGAAWAGASVIWESEKMSILRQTLTHLVICSAATFPTAYFMRWMRHSVSGVLCYLGIFLCAYLLIWLSLYSSMKKRLREINRKLRENSSC